MIIDDISDVIGMVDLIYKIAVGSCQEGAAQWSNISQVSSQKVGAPIHKRLY